MATAQAIQSAIETDDELVRRAVNDPNAFALLYRQNIDAIYRYCFRRLGDRESAEDATQLTFEKILKV